MNNGEQPTGHLHPEQFAALIEAQLRQPRPKWVKIAIAKMLHVMLPNMTAHHWLACVENPDLIPTHFSTTNLPWLLGRIARCLSEMRNIGYAHFPFLENLPWFLKGKFEEERLVPGEGRGFEEIIWQEMQKMFLEPTEGQVKFWQSFANGFSRDLAPRPQDVKAFVVYVFLILNWQEAEKCKTVRELYDFVFSKMPKEPGPTDVDPSDFEDRHRKWFEKLCHRNLKLRLAEPGRPKRLT